MVDKKEVCGIVMPISECDGRPSSHWADVLDILESAANEAGFSARLVSDTFESNLIHKEILQNIYNDRVIICDVSGRNPNVFFELGIRMATQLPTVIIKDDKTAYPFDTAPNRYIEYPRDLRHPAMEKFKAELTKTLKNTAKHGKDKSFIGQLGPFHIPDVESTKLPASEIILERLDRLERSISNSASDRDAERNQFLYRNQQEKITFSKLGDDSALACVRGIGVTQVENGIRDFVDGIQYGDEFEFEIEEKSPLHVHIRLNGRRANSRAAQSIFRRSVLSAIPF
ncbi:hypothetical protein [Ruegeria sp. HKCCD6157]|uniref:hypothetical protein n=1 Tax=Ruegeria sp. HKCCD6157 TaxID=2690707 RepID=UPI0014915B52|nr:hypothetical protein [Ruegeria sp. HKCCD6157]NOE28277.1 hypothetical protein [Ruegeria sp. HKCCD6157]